ncbi:hypothetical protein DESPIGER_0281 [Desulfovibrio piger]|uniref:Uncharacterized protein n=1 Tax=Desulfovibrio piger TaxID=901 RepID=A0A1K1LFG1_9BACT|nr:hypothetical protein DESPIGER_0281 [Desulfovibrio piger]
MVPRKNVELGLCWSGFLFFFFLFSFFFFFFFFFLFCWQVDGRP